MDNSIEESAQGISIAADFLRKSTEDALKRGDGGNTHQCFTHLNRESSRRAFQRGVDSAYPKRKKREYFRV